MKRSAIIFILMLCSIALFASPFGLEMGWTKQDLIANNVDILLEEGNAFLVDPPSPHSSFSTYLLVIDSDFGLYFIIATSDEINTSGNGRQLLSKYNDIKDQLISSYGDPTNDINKLDYGSIWDEPQDFMMSLLRGERTIGCDWIDEDNDNMKITLMPMADSSTSGTITLIYTSRYYDEIEAKTEAAEASVL